MNTGDGHRGGLAGRLALLVALLACALPTPLANARIVDVLPSGAGSGRYLPGEAIVRFEPGASRAERREARRDADVRFEETLGLPRAEVVEVEGSVAAAVRRLERQPGVAYAQPNFRYEAVAVEAPDDTFFGELWGLSDPALPNPGVSALEAWEESEGAGQVIAVLDTGVDLTHPDLAANLWVNPAEDEGAPSVDDDGNGCTDDLHGCDFVEDSTPNPDGNPDDYQFHGTHVAGTAAAIAGNGEGIAGVAPAAKIMAVRVLDGDGGGLTSEIAPGIEYAAENGADVINMSLSGLGPGDELMSDAVDLAAAEDVVVVAAAGNEKSNNDAKPAFPCTMPQANLICVAALNRNGALAGFSNYGAKSVDLAAPGGGDKIPNGAILSAKADYGPITPPFEDGFESGFPPIWETEASPGGIEWGLSPLAAVGTQSATDSPAPEQDYAPEAETLLLTQAPIDLSGKRGCRVHFRTKYEIEPPGPGGFFDVFLAGATDEEGGIDGVPFAGTSSGFGEGAFLQEEASISEHDGRNDVHPLFGIASDELVEMDGAYVDDVRVICRDETYDDTIASSTYNPSEGNYVRFQGTSMAAPHVTGVAALVRAAEPGATATQVVDAILAGASAIPAEDPARPTATNGIADACQAIAVATGKDFTVECPGSNENAIPPPDAEPGDGGGTAAIDLPPPSHGASASQPLRTFFRKRPRKVVRTRFQRAKVVFRFGSSEEGASFVCRIDGGLFRFCPARLVRRFGLGRHTVRVVARADDGRADETPAVYRFRVKRAGQSRSAHLRRDRPQPRVAPR